MEPPNRSGMDWPPSRAGPTRYKRRKKGTVALKTSHLVIAVFLIAAIGAGAYFAVNYFSKPEEKQPQGGGLVFDPNAKDYTGDDPENKGGEKQGIKIPGYGTVTLPAGKTDVKMVLLNPEGNPCYFTFELVVDGETYYKSGLVEPSKCIEDLKLTKPLKKGEYQAVLKVRTFSLDESLTPMNSSDVKFDLVVP